MKLDYVTCNIAVVLCMSLCSIVRFCKGVNPLYYLPHLRFEFRITLNPIMTHLTTILRTCVGYNFI